MLKKKNGITIISLIITIIVLLILAGVTINMVLGENGLINKSKSAKEKQDAVQNNEVSWLDYIGNKIDKYIAGTDEECTIIYNSNDGNGQTNTITGMALRVADNEFSVPEGKKFSEWNTMEDGSGTSYKPGELILINTTLYAQWIDGIAPTIVISSLQNSKDYLFAIKAQITITDEQGGSGINNNECKYVYTADNNEITEEELYTEGVISSNGSIETLKGPGTWYLHVMAKDSDGNIKFATSQNAITVANVANYPYTSSNTAQTASLLPGEYKMECWGAGGGTKNSSYRGGYGGYTAGNLNLSTAKTFYIYVGQSSVTGGWNGGGSGGGDGNYGAGGGGATDIRTISGNWDNANSLRSRIMVAGAGAGSGSRGDGYGDGKGGDAGGLETSTATIINVYASSGGGTSTATTQTSGGSYKAYWNNVLVTGSFGKAGGGAVGGGSGWYGGAGSCHGGGVGGTSYISGHDGCIGVISLQSNNPAQNSESPTGYIYSNTKMIDGAGCVWTTQKGGTEQMPNPNGGYYAAERGHSGNGYARITNLN